MQEDFHYYATYCSAILAGYTVEESSKIAYSAALVDFCTRGFLKRLNGPKAAVTTQFPRELFKSGTDPYSLQYITRIWASFHFLPWDLNAKLPNRPRWYLNKYRLICRPNGELLTDTVKLAKGKGPEAAGVAMHVLADTWSHSYFAGTPSLVINNTDYHFYELYTEDGEEKERRISFNHNPKTADDFELSKYTGSFYQSDENSVMNLGHGRAGHLPDYSYARYKYMPAWADYNIVIKDNPSDYYRAFGQMTYALAYLKGSFDDFAPDTYAEDLIAPYAEEIKAIIKKKQIIASDDWRALGEKISGVPLEEFSISKYEEEYIKASNKRKQSTRHRYEDPRDYTFLGRFFVAAMAQKSMVTYKIYSSGNLLAGISVDYYADGFKGIKDFQHLIRQKTLAEHLKEKGLIK